MKIVSDERDAIIHQIDILEAAELPKKELLFTRMSICYFGLTCIMP